MTQDEYSTEALRAVLLPGLGALRIAGPDAISFLQGQFTNDVRLLADGRTQVSACCTNQGRAIAIVRFRQTDEAIYALMPTELLRKVAAHLRRYVLRAKVEILEAADLHVGAILTGAAATDSARRAFEESAFTMSPVPLAGSAEVVTFQWAEGREVVAAPAVAWRSISGLSLGKPSPTTHAQWVSADIAAGLPQLYAATSEQFIPQMLNLDLIDGISFSKGCYTGQEIVTRTQHLGRVKRRSMRFVLEPGPVPEPKSNLLLEGTKAADVLVTAELADRVELLAVTNLDAKDRVLTTEDGREAKPVALPYVVSG